MYNCVNYGNIKSTDNYACGLSAFGDGSKYYNCYNVGNVGRYGLAMANSSASAINCYSAGVLRMPPSSGGSGVLLYNGSTLTNCYYLNGIAGDTGITPEAGAIEFYKKGTDVLTSQNVVNSLNQYIDDHLNDADTTTNTSDWLRWQVGSDGLPELIFD